MIINLCDSKSILQLGNTRLTWLPYVVTRLTRAKVHSCHLSHCVMPVLAKWSRNYYNFSYAKTTLEFPFFYIYGQISNTYLPHDFLWWPKRSHCNNWGMLQLLPRILTSKLVRQKRDRNFWNWIHLWVNITDWYWSVIHLKLWVNTGYQRIMRRFHVLWLRPST